MTLSGFKVDRYYGKNDLSFNKRQKRSSLLKSSLITFLFPLLIYTQYSYYFNIMLERYMQAIEFVTTIKDGVIELPKQYRKNTKMQCRVIILLEGQKSKINVSKKKHVSAIQIKTKGLVFDRDEANER